MRYNFVSETFLVAFMIKHATKFHKFCKKKFTDVKNFVSRILKKDKINIKIKIY